MKKLFAFIVVVLIPLACMAQDMPKATFNGDLNKYKYVYVVPSGSVTASSPTHGGVYTIGYGVYGGVYGGATSTINPTDALNGILMQMGYITLPTISSDHLSETMVITYGYTGRRYLSLSTYVSSIILQIKDAQTEEIVATIESEGCGRDEAEDILLAIQSSMEVIQYQTNPKVEFEFVEVYKNYFIFLLTNKTLQKINNIHLRVTYYVDGEFVHEQLETVNAALRTNEEVRKTIKRDKEARSNKMQIKVDVLEYN